jgi:predicted ferric reductase
MLLDEARRQATALGLFLCGPVAMTEALKKEARNEDSWCLTRFVVYEELFEM